MQLHLQKYWKAIKDTHLEQNSLDKMIYRHITQRIIAALN